MNVCIAGMDHLRQRKKKNHCEAYFLNCDAQRIKCNASSRNQVLHEKCLLIVGIRINDYIFFLQKNNKIDVD